MRQNQRLLFKRIFYSDEIQQIQVNLIIIINKMSHQFSGNHTKPPSINPNSSGMQFYNPTKDTNHSTLLSQHTQSMNTLKNGLTLNKFQPSKQFLFKPTSVNQIKSQHQIKTNTSSTTFIKPSTDQSGSNKYVPVASGTSVTSSSILNKTLSSGTGPSTTSSFISPSQNKSLNSEMIKSSIQDMNSREFKKEEYGYKDTKTKNFETPNRRAPRMSEPVNNNAQIKHESTNINNNMLSSTQSPPTFLRDREKQKEGGFHKFKPFQSPTIEKFQSPILQKFDKSENFASKFQPISSPFRGAQNKLGQQQNIFIKRSYGKIKKLSMSDFDVIKQLGAGKYGKVFLAKQLFAQVRQKLTGFMCAVKTIQKQLLRQEQIVEQFIRQLKIQMFLNHPHIIKMYGYFDDETNIYIILQVCTGGQLYHQLKRSEQMPQQKAAAYIRQVCEAINQIHSLRIIHRDIKPENIVLHENIVKLCDFGWSVHQDNKMRTTFCGTPLYVCPQILRGKEYDQKIDIWSLGIMMYEMLVGQNPFKITKEEQLIKIVKDKIEIPSYVYVSVQARDFLDKCLQKNPTERVNIKELLNHPFLKKYPDKAQKKVSL